MQVKVRNDASIFTRSDIYPEIKKYFAYNDHRTSDYLKHATLKSLFLTLALHSLILSSLMLTKHSLSRRSSFVQSRARPRTRQSQGRSFTKSCAFSPSLSLVSSSRSSRSLVLPFSPRRPFFSLVFSSTWLGIAYNWPGTRPAFARISLSPNLS